jgi:hypothetical protein
LYDKFCINISYKQFSCAKRGPGRPPTNWVGLHLTLLPHTVEAIDKWIMQQEGEHITRQEAIRRLLDRALAAGVSAQRKRAKQKRRG